MTRHAASVSMSGEKFIDLSNPGNGKKTRNNQYRKLRNPLAAGGMARPGGRQHGVYPD
jgi:hypothetical protein